MIYKTPQQHNNAVKTTLTNGIRKLLARRKYSSVKPVMLKEALEYHQKINDIEIKRMFCEDLAKMQKVLPVITMDKGLMLKVKKVLSKHGFALMHMSDDMYLSTTLMHKAGFSMSTKIKLDVANAKRTNIINMLNLSINMDETPDNKETDANGMPYKGIKHDIKEYTYQDQFMEALRFAVENGEDTDYKFGEPLDTLENAYSGFVQMKEQGVSDWDECIEAYEEAFFAVIFMNGTKFAVENEKGTNYKFNPPSPMSLEKGYKQLLATKKETGTDDLNEYIDYYEDVFYEEVFIYAVNESLKYGLGVEHKFTVNQITLEQAHNSMLIDKGHGAVKWDACIKAYDDAFNCKGSHGGDKVKDDGDKDSPVTTLPKTETETKKKDDGGDSSLDDDLDTQFIDAVKYSKKHGKGRKYKFGNPLVTLEEMYSRMRELQAYGAKKWDDCIEAYNEAFYKEEFLEAINKAVELGKGIEHRFGEDLDTLESAYNKMLDRQLKGSKEWDVCIKAYEDAFYEEQFIKAIKRAVKYGKGIKYKFGKNLNTLEYLYEVMITKQDNGSTKDDNCITAYQTTFYEEAFMSAINRAQDNGLGTSYKFGVYTIERVYKELMTKKEGGADNYDDCITKYQDTFQQSAFIDAVKRAIKYRAGINYKFGEKQHTLENVYKGMVTMQDGGSDKWDAGIKKYRNTFPKTSFMDAVKRAKQNGQNGNYWFIKNEKTLKSFFDEMIIWEGGGDQEHKECIAWYIHNFGWNPS